MNERPNMFAQNDTPISIHERVELPDEQLRALAPAVFAAQAMPGVSSRYAFVPTACSLATVTHSRESRFDTQVSRPMKSSKRASESSTRFRQSPQASKFSGRDN